MCASALCECTSGCSHQVVARSVCGLDARPAATGGTDEVERVDAGRVRSGLIQLAWRFLRFQKDSSLAQWLRSRTGDVKGARMTTMIVALARKLLIALWRMVTTGEVPQAVVFRQPADMA
jgi:hypothetical protein